MILAFPHNQSINVFGATRSENKYAQSGLAAATVDLLSPNLTAGHTHCERMFMSLHLMSAVWRLEIPTNEKIVLLALADHAKDDGACWPGIPLLAKKCSLSERQIQRILKRLDKIGFIRREFRHARSTKYQVMVTGMSPSAKEGVTLMSPPPDASVTSGGDIHVTQNRKSEPERTLEEICVSEEEKVKRIEAVMKDFYEAMKGT